MAQTMMDMYKSYRWDVEECFDMPLHNETFPCRVTKPKKKGEPPRTDFACLGKAVPGYFHPERCQILFVGLHPTKKEVESTNRVRAPFVDKYGTTFSNLLRSVDLYGDQRLGYTTLTKCHLNNKRTVKAVVKSCSHFLEDEIRLCRPHIIVPLGEEVAKFLCPEIFEEPVSYKWSLCGEFYSALDRTFFFLPSIDDIFDANGNVKASEEVYAKMAMPSFLVHLKASLMSDDDWFMMRHPDRVRSAK